MEESEGEGGKSRADGAGPHHVPPPGVKVHPFTAHHRDPEAPLLRDPLHRRRRHRLRGAYAFPFRARASHEPAEPLRVRTILERDGVILVFGFFTPDRNVTWRAQVGYNDKPLRIMLVLAIF